MSDIFEKKVRINELTQLRNSYMQQGKVIEEVAILKELAKLTEEVIAHSIGGKDSAVNDINSLKNYCEKIRERYNSVCNL